MIAGAEWVFFLAGVLSGFIWGAAITLRRLRNKPLIGKKGTYYFTKSEGENK